MAGYDYSEWKSNNALMAEQSGMATASVLSRRFKVSTQDIKNNVSPMEWHHTSSWYNRTLYYDPECVEDFLMTKEGREALERYRNKDKQTVQVHKRCRVEWIEWDGTRNRPIPVEMIATGATVSVKGQTATIQLKDGTSFTKRLTTNGFNFTCERAFNEEQRRIKEWNKELRLLRFSLKKRFNAHITNKRFEIIDYFDYRDLSSDSWKPVLQKDLRAIFDAALEENCSYAKRTIDRLERGERDVVRVGLRHGIREA